MTTKLTVSIFSLVSVHITFAGDIVLFPINTAPRICNGSSSCAVELRKGVIRARRHFKNNL